MLFFYYVQLIPGREYIDVFTLFFLKHWKLLWPVSQLEYHCYTATFVYLISNSYRLYILCSTWLNWVCRMHIFKAIGYISVFRTSVIQVQMSTILQLSIYHIYCYLLDIFENCHPPHPRIHFERKLDYSEWETNFICYK